MADRILIIMTIVALCTVTFIFGLHLRSEAQWHAFTHCRLMDLERGSVTRDCKLGARDG